MGDVRWLSFQEAAKRVDRSVRAIKYWHQGGMPMDWRTGSDNQRERVVREDVLLEWWRDRMRNDPVHQQRMRVRRRAGGFPEPVLAVRPVKRDQPQTAPTQGGTPEHASDGRTEPESTDTAPRVNPLADMKPLRGGPEYGELHEALKDTQPACRDIDAFIADKITADEAQIMAGICANCNVLELCRAFVAKNQPEVGFWAGLAAADLRHAPAA